MPTPGKSSLAAALALSTLVALRPSEAATRATSARFLPMRAVDGSDLRVRVEVEDTIGAVHRVQVYLRPTPSAEWRTSTATKSGGEWIATFPSALLPKPPAEVELRAELLGSRGGLLLSLGDDDPERVAVLSVERAAAEQAILGRIRAEGEGPALTGFVGLEARVGSSARVRAVIGAGAHLSRRAELYLGVSVGPVFDRPPLLEKGGPFVLGFEGALRFYTTLPGEGAMTPFLEPYANADLRLPGFDPGVGLRLGLTRYIGEATALDLAVGGAFTVYRALAQPEDTAVGGFSGGLRLAVRLGAPNGSRAR